MLESRLVKTGRLATSVADVVILHQVLRLYSHQGHGRLLGPQGHPARLPCAQLGLDGHLGRIGEIHVVFVCWPPTDKKFHLITLSNNILNKNVQPP